MTGGGWIKLHRKIMENPFYMEKPFDKGKAWIDLILMANHEDRDVLLRREIVRVERGSFITSELKLMDRWGWSKEKLRLYLKLLQEQGMIIKKSDRKKTVITIVKYDDFQGGDSKSDHEQTTKRPPADYDPYTNKNLRIKELKNIETHTPLGQFASLYKEAFGIDMGPMEIESLNSYLDDDGMELDLLTEGLRTSIKYGAGSFRYTEKIYNKWIRLGVRTLEEWKRHEANPDNENKIRQFPKGGRNKSNEVLYSSEELGGW